MFGWHLSGCSTYPVLLSSDRNLTWVEIKFGFPETLTELRYDFLHVVIVAKPDDPLEIRGNLDVTLNYNRHTTSG